MILVQLIVVAIIVVVVLQVLRPSPAFVVEVKDGTATVTRGAVPPEFLKDLEDICREASHPSLRVRGFRGEQGVRLGFGAAVSASDRQRIRNAWSFHA